MTVTEIIGPRTRVHELTHRGVSRTRNATGPSHATARHTEGGLSFKLLGPLRAFRGGVELDLGSPQQRTMLAILLLHEGGVVPLEALVDAVWAEDPPRAAIGTLRTYASRLRRVLAPAALEATTGGYVLRLGRTELDLQAFRSLIARAAQARRDGRAEDALELLGEALALGDGAPIAGIPGMYAAAKRAALIESRLAAELDSAAIELDLGHFAAPIARLSEMVVANPLRERPRELLMLGLYRCGRQAEALSIFHDCRHLLADQLGVNPGPGLQAMFQRIIEADPTLIRPSPSAVQHPAKVPPAELPPFPADFTGRADQLRTIVKQVRQCVSSGKAVAGVVGERGVGASTLAIRAAHALRETFPDGQLYVDLNQRAQDPLDPGFVPARFLRVLGVPDDQIPAYESDRLRLWRERLTGRRLLVVLDNVPDAAHLNALFPVVPGCAVIITTRHKQPYLQDVHWTELAGFDAEEGLELLERIAGAGRIRAETDAARPIVTACGGLPRWLRACGSRLASRPNWTLSSFETWLREHGLAGLTET